MMVLNRKSIKLHHYDAASNSGILWARVVTMLRQRKCFYRYD